MRELTSSCPYATVAATVQVPIYVFLRDLVVLEAIWRRKEYCTFSGEIFWICPQGFCELKSL